MHRVGGGGGSGIQEPPPPPDPALRLSQGDTLGADGLSYKTAKDIPSAITVIVSYKTM